MAKFIYIFVGGAPAKGQEEQNMKDWRDWIQSLQDKKVYDSGLPFGWTKKTVKSDGTVEDSKNPNSGYAIVEASSIDEAMDWAKTGPVGKYGGSTEVYDIMDMPGM